MFDQAIASFRPGLPLAVALSGGADSTALLLACALKWPGQVRAVHVHHGLQRAADDFERHAVDLCARIGVPLVVRRIDARHAPGESPEDAARRGRYAAIADAVRTHWPDDAIGDVAVAQHADDQVETLLLALSRGAGLPGLSAMPAHWKRDGLNWHRPLLRVPGAQLREWLIARGVTWIEDPSNADEKFTRNRIRAQLLPALENTFPQFRETFARSARHAAQAQELLTELAAQDLERTGNPPVIHELRALSANRQGNLLRHWLRTSHGTAPSAAQMGELLAQVANCATRGNDIRIKVGLGRVTRAGAQLQFERD
ncbi:tRNA lysidine(34) synthetase TilS [Caenimonas sp. SL110]|uniref:tRNA lysidine(34) synthetase TilS n=1 Tax=Caenimonas sp. SL110 TaxID=1450524 RepID=UPI0006535BE7|nr:tRNA lysidine(34) synthetase TilS [Caenimonas sp. SL110]